MHPYHELLNRTLWAAGLLLQCTLLFLLARRDRFRALPIFTALIAFYTVRTTLLYTLARHMAGPSFAMLKDLLSFTDLLLQLALAAEIAHHLLRRRGGWNRRSTSVLIALVGLAASAGWFAGFLLRSAPRIPIDRAQVFTSCLMLLLYAWSVWLITFGPVERILKGFALYGFIGLLAQAGHATTTLHRNAPRYVLWSYTSAAVYLLVVLFWCLTLPAAIDEERAYFLLRKRSPARQPPVPNTNLFRPPTPQGVQ